jgi:addiction module HigA family antidote
MVRIPTNRAPTHPGEMLRIEVLNPLGMTQRELAEAIGVPYQRINEIVNGRRGITPSTALRLPRYSARRAGGASYLPKLALPGGGSLARPGGLEPPTF